MTGGVCILTETYWPVVGGGETQARVLASGLADRGLRVTVVTRRSDRSLAEKETVGGVRILRLPPSGRRHLNKWGLMPTALPVLVRLRERYDALLVCGFRVLGVPALLAGGLVGRPCILKADSLGEMSGGFFEAGLKKLGLGRGFIPFRLTLALRNKLLRRADAFVAISVSVRDELTSAGVSETRIESIPNGVDTERFRPVDPADRGSLRRKLGLDLERKLVVYTGRLVSYKGLPVLLRAWRELRGDATLVLVGSGGLDIHDCERELRSFVKEHALQDRVVFAGEVDDVVPFLQAADVYAFPTENEAFGLSLVEAMACGLPAVATTIGGVADILRPGATGLAVPPRGEREIAAALDSLLSESDLAVEMGARARRVAVEEFSAGRVVQRYLDLIGRVVERTRAR
jgi:glycosyltransferase involved in cell wall biosynthesis